MEAGTGIGHEAILAGAVRCKVCSRTPLAGEWATLHQARRREVWVCDLCETHSARVLKLGEPIRRDRVRSTAGALNVRRA